MSDMFMIELIENMDDSELNTFSNSYTECFEYLLEEREDNEI